MSRHTATATQPINTAVSAAAPTPERSPLARIGTAIYRIGVLALLAVIAWPRIQGTLSELPSAAAVTQTGGGFRLGPSRYANNNNNATPPKPTPANPPSALLTKYGFPTYGDAYPGTEDLFPRNYNDVPIVYVVNLPWPDGGRTGTVPAYLKGADQGTANQFKP